MGKERAVSSNKEDKLLLVEKFKFLRFHSSSYNYTTSQSIAQLSHKRPGTTNNANLFVSLEPQDQTLFLICKLVLYLKLCIFENSHKKILLLTKHFAI